MANTGGGRPTDYGRRRVLYATEGNVRDLARRMDVPEPTARFSGQFGIGMVRVDTDAPVFNAVLENWLGEHREMFLRHPVVEQARRTTDPGAQWDFTVPTGRVLRLKRAEERGRVWLVAQDVTLECDHETAIAQTADLGTGFFQYTRANRRNRVYGSFLDDRLTPSEQLELRRRGLLSIVHPRDVERVRDDLMGQLLRDGRDVRALIQCRCRRSKSFVLDVTARAIRGADGRVAKVIGAFREVTEERRARGELQRLRNEAESDREARKLMMSRVSHEIRTPLNGVIGMADALANAEGTERIRPQLRIIQSASRDAVQMLDEMMHMGRGEGREQFALRPETTDVAEVVRDVCALWGDRAEAKGLTLMCAADEALGEVVLDPRRLRQILTNLLSNAVKLTERGRIDVVVAVAGERTDGERLVVAVRDTGPGLSAADKTRVFRPYHQAEAGVAAGGSGLGLSITRELVTRMGGTLTCQSEPGSGATFILALPLERPATAEEAGGDLVASLMAGHLAPVSPFAQLRVLAVDDNETNRLVVENLLHGRVRSVTLAQDGREAVELMRGSAFDVVLMDIHMPVMDGIEATLAIRESGEAWSDTPIIALTADSDYHSRRVVMNLGMDDALAKPVGLAKILEAFERLALDRVHTRTLGETAA